MSHAVVLAPPLVPVLAVPLVAIAATYAVVMMIQYLSKVPEVDLKCEAVQKAVRTLVDEIGRGLDRAAERVERETNQGEISGKGKAAIEAELGTLRNSVFPQVLKAMTAGTLTTSDITMIRDRIEALELLQAQQKALYLENRKRAAFLETRLAGALDAVQGRFPDKVPIAQVEQKRREILETPDTRIEEKVAALTELLGILESVSEQAVIDDVVARLLEAGSAPTADRRPRPRPAAPASAAREAFDRAAHLQGLKTDLAFTLEKLLAEFPEAVPAQLRALAEEAATSPLLQRVAAVRDQVKLAYQTNRSRVVLTEFFRSRLAEFLAALDEGHPLHGEIADAMARPVLERQEFTRLVTRFETHLARKLEEEQRRFLEEKVRGALAKLDYVILQDDGPAALARKLAESGLALLETRYPDFRVILRLGKNETLSLRLIRIVAREEDKQGVSEYQRKQDQEIKEEWCHSADQFRLLLNESGVLLVEKLRMEDEVQYFTLEQLEQQGIDVSRLRDRPETTTRKPQPAQQKGERKGGPV